jgi:hypothetical protein
VEKHDRNAYDLAADELSNEQRAAIFSKVLGKPIKYEQQSIEDCYKAYINLGMSHSLAYNLISFFLHDFCRTTTPQVAIIIGRPLRTLEQWLTENAGKFQ